MVAVYAFPEQRSVDTKFFLIPNTSGTSSALETPWRFLSEPTGMEEYSQFVSNEGGSAIEQLINRAVLDFSSVSLFIIRDRTSTANQDFEMSLLEAAASMGDEAAFAEVVNSIKWDHRSTEEYIKALRLALSIGAHPQARQLAAEGGLRFPENDEMQEYTRLLAPSRIVNAHVPPDLNAAADMRWLKAHREEYLSQWVALRGGTLIVAAPTRKDLLAQLEDPKDKSVLITPVY